MKLTIIDLKTKKFNITILNESITLKDLKLMIQKETLIEIEYIRIIANGKIANDDEIICDLKYKNLIFLNFLTASYY
jgi:hypothetical protein